MRGSHLLVALFALTTLSGCFGDDNADDEPAEPQETDTDQNMTVEPPTPMAVAVGLTGAFPANIAYDPATITVANHTLVNLTFTNSDTNPLGSHDWVLEGVEGAATDIIGVGETSTVSFLTPPPGTYAFYCSVPGHRANGMEGTFTVTA